MGLTGDQRRDLVQAIRQAFDFNTLSMFLFIELDGLKLDEHVRANSGFAVQAAEFVRFLEANPRMGDFLRAAANSQNVHPSLRDLATSLLDSNSAPGVTQVLPAAAFPQDPHLCSREEKVDLIRRFSWRQIDAFLVPDEIVTAFAGGVDDEAAATGILHQANALRRLADPQLPPHSLVVDNLPKLGIVGAQSFWMQVFVKACSRGGRMLGALLLATPPVIFETHRNEIFALLTHCMGTQP